MFQRAAVSSRVESLSGISSYVRGREREKEMLVLLLA